MLHVNGYSLDQKSGGTHVPGLLHDTGSNSSDQLPGTVYKSLVFKCSYIMYNYIHDESCDQNDLSASLQ